MRAHANKYAYEYASVASASFSLTLFAPNTSELVTVSNYLLVFSMRRT